MSWGDHVLSREHHAKLKHGRSRCALCTKIEFCPTCEKCVRCDMESLFNVEGILVVQLPLLGKNKDLEN